jgi:hypothetical protein
MGWYQDVKDYFTEGTCKNNTDKDIQVCMGEPDKPHEIMTLRPGESSPTGKDCDGIMKSDGGTTKIIGRTFFTSEYDANWVKSHWPECSEFIRSINLNTIGTDSVFVAPSIAYAVRTSNYGWTPDMPNGWFIGERDIPNHINGIRIVSKSPEIGIKFYTHWASGQEQWSNGGEVNNPLGIALAVLDGIDDFIDAFSIQLTSGSDKYDIIYKAHVEGYGDSAFFGNGTALGVMGKMIQGIIIGIVPKAPVPPTPSPPTGRHCRGGCDLPSNNYRIENHKEVPLAENDSFINGDYQLSSTDGQGFPIFAKDLPFEERAVGLPIYIPELNISKQIPSLHGQVTLL